MKKFSILLLVLTIALSMCACGRSRNDETLPSTEMTILPDMDPTFETNIPDPDVNTSMPMYTEGTGYTDETNSGSGMSGNGGNN